MQPRLHGAIALIPTPSFELAQTRTVGAHGCWDYLAGVPASSNVDFALGGPRNGRVRQKNGQGENRRKQRKMPNVVARMQALLGRCSGCSSPRRAVRTYSQYLSRHLRARPRARPVWEAVWRFFAEIGVVDQNPKR